MPCSCRSSASTTRSRVSGNCCATSRSSGRTSTRPSTWAASCSPCTTRARSSPIRSSRRCGTTSAQRCTARWSPVRSACRRPRRSGSRSSSSTRRLAVRSPTASSQRRSAVARQGGLGKGLGALIPTPGISETQGGLQQIAVASIRPNRYQPRAHFDEEELGTLAESIRAVGVLQPILVRPIGDEYELIAGERRWRAARRVGLQTVPALVRETDDTAALEQALVENLHRASLNSMEEAAGYQQLIEDFELTHEQVANRVGRSRSAVTNALRLLQLPPAVQRLVQEGQLDGGHARALLGSPDRAFQEQLARRTVKDGLSVRAVEEAVRAHQQEGAPPERNPATAATRRLRPPGLLELEELLGDYLDTRVKVDMGSRKGRVVIEFSTLEDLERIYRVVTEGPGAAQTQPGAVEA